MFAALLVSAFTAGAAPTVALSPEATTTHAAPAGSPTSTPTVEVRPLYRIGVPVDLPTLGKGRFVADADSYGFQVVPTDRYAEDLKYRFLGEEAAKGSFAVPNYQKWTLFVTTFVVPVLVETYREVKKK